MPILVNCEKCGKGYRFRDDQAGQSVQCKNCGWDIDIPRRRRAAPTQRRPQQSARRPSQAVATPSSENHEFLDKPSSISTTKILVGVGVAAGVLLMLLIVVVVFVLSGRDGARTVAESGRPNLDRGTNSTRPGENSRTTSANTVKPIF